MGAKEVSACHPLDAIPGTAEGGRMMDDILVGILCVLLFIMAITEIGMLSICDYLRKIEKLLRQGLLEPEKEEK